MSSCHARSKGKGRVVRANFWGVGLEVKRHPCRGEGVIGIWVQLFIALYSFLKLLLAHGTPRTHSVAHYFDVELCHFAKTGAEHAKKRTSIVLACFGICDEAQ